MFKRYACIFLSIALLLGLTACSKPPYQALKDADDGVSVLPQYSLDASDNSNGFEVPENYLPMGENVYAVLNEQEEVVGYKKAVFSADENKYIFFDCDYKGNILESSDDDDTGDDDTGNDTPNISFEDTDLEIAVGEVKIMAYAIEDGEYVPENVVWTSSDENIATVENGKITGVKEGRCDISVNIDGYESTCHVTVVSITTSSTTSQTTTSNSTTTTQPTTSTTKPQNISPSSIKLNKTSATLTVGSMLTLTATISPTNATNKKVTWSSSNTAVATVSSGKVTAKGKGTATITAKTANGKTATCKITVNEKVVAPSGISLNTSSMVLYVGENAILSATLSPSNVTEKTITWTSSNTKVATVTDGKVTAVGAGTAKITAKTSNGKTATCTITVKNKVVPLQWSVVSLSSCPQSVNTEFSKYTSSTSAKTMSIQEGGYVYIMIKVAKGKKVTVTSVTESGAKIVITTTNKSGSNVIYIRHNKPGYSLEVK